MRYEAETRGGVKPVVSGATDAKTTALVFKEWGEGTPPFNPHTELHMARRLADDIIRQFLIRRTDLAGTPQNERVFSAQLALIRTLVRARDWTKKMLESYLGTRIPKDTWKEATA